MTIEFFIPGEAVPQLRPRIIRKGRHLGLKDPEKVKDYKAYVRLLALEKLRKHNGRFPVGLPIRLYARFYLPIPQSWSKRRREEAKSGRLKHSTKPDLDNLIKAVTDALTGVIWKDDKQLFDVYMKKEYSEEKIGIYLRINVIN